MKDKQFDKLANKYFGALLEPFGFSHEKSRYCTFHRQVSKDIYHVIVPELGGSGRWFHLEVFATSPLIEPGFEQMFPDDVGTPSDMFSRLHAKRGIGTSRTTFRCNKEEGFVRNFTREAAPAVLEHAIPHLDKIQTLEDIFATIKVTKKVDGTPNSEFYYGVGLWQLGRKEEALPILRREREKISRITADPEGVRRDLKFIDNLISPRLIENNV